MISFVLAIERADTPAARRLSVAPEEVPFPNVGKKGGKVGKNWATKQRQLS